MRHNGEDPGPEPMSGLFDADDWTRRLSARERVVMDAPELRPSAVLVPMFWREHAGRRRLHLIVTKRSEEVSSHKGQYCFPGGRQDPEDRSLADTALRECEEEIGLPRSHVRILGPLDDLRTVWGVRITPYLALVPAGHAYRTDPREVERVLEVPASAFLNPALLRIEPRVHPDGQLRNVYYFDLDGEIVWGATARIIVDWLALTASELGCAPQDLLPLFGG